MFNISKIKGLYGVVGFQQPQNPDFQIIDANNLVSRSGYFVTSNPYCKVENIKSNIDYKDASNIEFNDYLKQLQEDSIVRVAGLVFNQSDYIDRQVLYPHAHNKVDTNDLPSGFVGFKIEVSIDKDVAFKISRVLLDFEGSGDIELLLFNTSSSTPLQSKTVSISSTNQEVKLDWTVDNSGSTYKGDYYLGYLNNAGSIGSLKPFKRNYDRSSVESCISCLDITKVSFGGMTSNALPDLRTEESIGESIGLNPDITVFEDFTDLMLQNEMLFAKAINMDLQINILSAYLASLRSNRDERNSERTTLRIIQQIEGQNSEGVIKITGLRPQLIREISMIGKEIRKIKEGYFGGRIQVATLT